MQDWKLIGPKIPVLVWYSRLLCARRFDSAKETITWSSITAKEYSAFKGKVLLLIHGTGLRSQAGFLGITESEFNILHEQYNSQILAFEHCAIRHHLDRNSKDLVTGLEKFSNPLNLDVIGLSRGGLVMRRIVEGWTKIRDNIRINSLVFVGTPNDGTPSARRNNFKVGAKEMQAWRRDVRRVALVNQQAREAKIASRTDTLFDSPEEGKSYLTWPILKGTQDLVPNSNMLDILNGFCEAAPFSIKDTIYFAIASIFNFDNGVPNPVLTSGLTRKDIVTWTFNNAKNDLVVPTFSVFSPRQGSNACLMFPIPDERLMLLQPSCNATHVGLFRMNAVRNQIFKWLNIPLKN
jgi:hypothetical protein